MITLSAIPANLDLLLNKNEDRNTRPCELVNLTAVNDTNGEQSNRDIFH